MENRRENWAISEPDYSFPAGLCWHLASSHLSRKDIIFCQVKVRSQGRQESLNRWTITIHIKEELACRFIKDKAMAGRRGDGSQDKLSRRNTYQSW